MNVQTLLFYVNDHFFSSALSLSLSVAYYFPFSAKFFCITSLSIDRQRTLWSIQQSHQKSSAVIETGVVVWNKQPKKSFEVMKLSTGMNSTVAIITLFVLPSIVGTAKVTDYLEEVPQNLSFTIAFPMVSKYYSVHILCILHLMILFYIILILYILNFSRIYR